MFNPLQKINKIYLNKSIILNTKYYTIIKSGIAKDRSNLYFFNNNNTDVIKLQSTSYKKSIFKTPMYNKDIVSCLIVRIHYNKINK